MSSNTEQPSRQALQAKTASRPGKVTGKLAEACRLMVEEGLTYQEAAQQAGLHVRSMYVAMQRRHVLAHLRAMREVFVERICLENPRHLAELRGQRANMAAAVRAVGQLEMMRNEPRYPGGVQTQPGLTVVIMGAAPAARSTSPVIDMRADDTQPHGAPLDAIPQPAPSDDAHMPKPARGG